MIDKKVMLLGDIGVGKSSIVNRLVFDRFESSYKPTIGVDIYRYQAALAGGQTMPLLVWDTDGNFGDAIFRSVYIREASAAIIISDLTRNETSETARTLASTFRHEFPGRPVVLLKNKSDLVTEHERSQALKTGEDLGLPVFVTSALSGQNIATAFETVATAIQQRHI